MLAWIQLFHDEIIRLFERMFFMPVSNPFLAPDKYRGFGAKQTIHQGHGCISKIPEILEDEDWKRVLLCIGPTLIRNGTAQVFEDMLKSVGIIYEVFSEIKPNPLQTDIEGVGIPLFKKMNADVLLAIGGGSTMDSAKAIAMVGETNMGIKEANNKCMDIGPYKPPPWKTYPMIAVPTTCGSGSEVIRNAVISEPDGHKMVLMQDCILPAYAVCDPDLLATLPQQIAAATVMDALVQAVEAYFSLAANDFSETMSLRAVEHMGPHIVQYYHDRSIPEHADAISKGCMYAGMAWNNSFPAQIHGTNHPITELLDISHGEACAILYPPFIEWNSIACKEKFRKVHNLMYPGEPLTEADFDVEILVNKSIQLNRDLNIMNGKSMADYGCTEETVDRMLSDFRGTRYTFPRATDRDEMKKIYMDVMNGKYL